MRPRRETRRPIWMVTFVDTMALLLTFFVMLFAMTVPQQEKWREIRASLSERIRDTASSIGRADSPLDPVETERATPALRIDYLAGLMTPMLRDDPVLADTIVTRLPDRLVLSLPDDLLFDRGLSSFAGAGAQRAVALLAGMLDRIGNRIEVVGHDAPRTGADAMDGRSWALSVSRAGVVAQALREAGYDRPVSVQGFGPTRFSDLSRRLPLVRREELARRVDIEILATGPEA